MKMAKTVIALKDILKRSESLLDKLQKLIPDIAHRKSKALLKEAAKRKKAAIATYKTIIKSSEKCPAIEKPKKKAPAKKAAAKKKAPAKKTAARKKTASKKK
jgi:hypothetical protein